MALAAVILFSGAKPPKDLKSDAEILELPPMEVRAEESSDFGLVLMSNRQVAAGGHVEWIIISTVVRQSGGANAGLRPGDRILSVNQRKVSSFSREKMLATFFRRPIGSKLALVVQDPNTDKPRLVVVECNETGVEPRLRK